MHRETLLLIALQSGALFVALWGIFRLVPSIPANAKAWMWRLAFLKPLLSLLPFATVSLPILHEEQGLRVEGQGLGEPILMEAAQPLPNPQPSTLDPLLAAWLLGVAGVSLHAFVGMRRALRVVSGASPVQSTEINRAYRDLLDKSGVRRRPALLQSENVASAMLIGGRRYAIILPSKALEGEFEDVRLMLAHEVAHIARHDLFWFGLASASQSLFFFNPMVWVAARCSRLDHESATDLHASRLAGVPIQRYADMLLRATVVARPSYAPGSLPVAESYRSIHRRLEAMKHFNSKPTLLRRTATAALAMLTLSLIPAYEVVAAGAPKMQEPPQIVPPQAAPKKPQAKKASTLWYYVAEDGEMTPAAAPKQTKYRVYEMKNGKWVEVKGGVKVWRVQSYSGKLKKGKKGKNAKIEVEFITTAPLAPQKPAKAPGAPGAPGIPGAPKALGAPGVPPVRGVAPARTGAPGLPPIAVAPGGVPAGIPPQPTSAPGAPGVPGVPAGQGRPGVSSPGSGAPAGMPPGQTGPGAGSGAPTRVTTATGQQIFVTPTVKVSGQGVLTTTQGGKITTAQGILVTPKVVTTQGGQVTTVSYSRLVPLTQGAKPLNYRVATTVAQGAKPLNYRVISTQGLQAQPQMIKGQYIVKPALINQGRISTPLKLDGKAYRVYTTGRLSLGKRKKGGAQEKPAPNNHHGATDPTYTGYSGV